MATALAIFSDIIAASSVAVLALSLIFFFIFQKHHAVLIRFPILSFSEILFCCLKAYYVGAIYGSLTNTINGTCMVVVVLGISLDVPGKLAATARLLLFYKQAKMNSFKLKYPLDWYVNAYAYLIAPGQFFRLTNRNQSVASLDVVSVSTESDTEEETFRERVFRFFFKGTGRFIICLLLHWILWLIIFTLFMGVEWGWGESQKLLSETLCFLPLLKVIGFYYFLWGITNIPLYFSIMPIDDKNGLRFEFLFSFFIMIVSSIVNGSLLIFYRGSSLNWSVYFDEFTMLLPSVLALIVPVTVVISRFLYLRSSEAKGEEAPLFSSDQTVSLNYGSNQSLDQLWRSNVSVFSELSQKYFIYENILFLLHTDYPTQLNSRRKFMELYKKFIRQGSEFELNLEDKVRKEFAEGVGVGVPRGRSPEKEDKSNSFDGPVNAHRDRFDYPDRNNDPEGPHLLQLPVLASFTQRYDVEKARAVTEKVRGIVLRMLYENMKRDLVAEMRKRGRTV
ncbi:hypothetical protein HK098_003966 [Nowakowskiella sp. JEL0407]|nr:hypothetical protein HK098_003966 [Nowakowskiella sp. JEL0407]